jgi:hypothetical protein
MRGGNMPEKGMSIPYCVYSWNQIMKELEEWKKLQEAVDAYSLTQMAA